MIKRRSKTEHFILSFWEDANRRDDTEGWQKIGDILLGAELYAIYLSREKDAELLREARHQASARWHLAHEVEWNSKNHPAPKGFGPFAESLVQ